MKETNLENLAKEMEFVDTISIDDYIKSLDDKDAQIAREKILKAKQASASIKEIAEKLHELVLQSKNEKM